MLELLGEGVTISRRQMQKHLPEAKSDDVLEGTTRRVFRFVYRQREPVGIHAIQRGLGLSSPSVASYHVGKLLKAGLLKEEGEGYIVDKVVFENMIRIGKSAVPFQTALAAFFLTALIVLMTVMRPVSLTSSYVFADAVVFVAAVVMTFEAYRMSGARY